MITAEAEYIAWDRKIIAPGSIDFSVTDGEDVLLEQDWRRSAYRAGANIVLVGKKRALNRATNSHKFIIVHPDATQYQYLFFATLIDKWTTTKNRGVYLLRGEYQIEPCYQSVAVCSVKEQTKDEQ